VVREDGSEYVREFTEQELAQWKKTAAADASSRPRHGYVSEQEFRFAQLNDIAILADISAGAFYQRHKRMPETASELENSGYFWFNPIPKSYSTGLAIVGRPLEAPAKDFNSVQITFNPSGYNLLFYDPYNRIPPESGESVNEYTRVDMSRPEFASEHEMYLAEVNPSPTVVQKNDPLNVRIDYLQDACDYLVARYWGDHLELPSTAEALLDGKWTVPNSILNNLEAIPEDGPGWFYLGVSSSKHIAYMEYMYVNTAPAITQKIYIENDPSAPNDGVERIGRYVCHSESISRKDTTAIIDAQMPGWGLASS
jgi:hypothetical protein